MSWLYLLGTIFCVLPLFLITPIKRLGHKKVKRGKAIYAMNHFSMFDPIIMSMVFPYRMIHYLGKSELFVNRIIRFFGRGFGAIPVNRGKADLKAIKEVVGVLNRNKAVGIFPEGTRNKEQTAEMGELKNGVALFALKTNAPIIPMYQLSAPRAFRMNYVYIGEPFYVTDVPGDKINKERLALATKMLTEHMNLAKEEMLKYAAEHNIKIRPPKKTAAETEQVDMVQTDITAAEQVDMVQTEITAEQVDMVQTDITAAEQVDMVQTEQQGEVAE